MKRIKFNEPQKLKGTTTKILNISDTYGQPTEEMWEKALIEILTEPDQTEKESK